MGIYSVAENGDLSRVAVTANNTALFSAINTDYPVPLTASWSKVAGRWYAHAVLIVSAATMPTWHGMQLAGTNPTNVFVRISPPLIGRVLSQTDLLTSFSAGSVVGYQGAIGMYMYA